MNRARLLVVCLAAAVLLLAAPFAWAQDERQPLFSAFHMEPIQGSLFLEGDYRTDERNSPGGGTFQNDSLFIQEGIDLNSSGFIYHPNFMDWTGRVRVGASQTDSTYNGDDRNSDGILLGHDFASQWFRLKPLSFRLFSNYQKNQTNRDFATTLNYETLRNGFEVIHRDVFTTSALFEHRIHNEQSDVEDRDEEGWLARLNSKYQSDQLDLDLLYEHETIDETTSPAGGGASFDQPTDRDEFRVNQTLRFGEGPAWHTLSGTTRYFTQRGFFQSDSFLTDQRLTLNHSPTLLTFYSFSYDTQNSDEQDDENIRAEVGVTKKFYESLDVTLRGFGEQQTFEEGEELRYGAAIDALYRKKTPVGTYRSNLSYSRTWVNETAPSGQRRIVGETITLTSADFVPLSQIGVIPGSITVSSLDRTEVYVEGVHYNVRFTGQIAEIQRIVFAADPIPDGAVVLVDYSVVQGQDSTYTQDELNWTHRLEIESINLAPYVRLMYLREDLESGDDPGNLNNINSITLGVDYRLGGLYASYEYQTLDSDLSLSYNAHRVRGQYNHVVGRDINFTVGGDAEWLTYTNGDEFDLDSSEDFLTTYHMFGQYSHRLTRNLLWRVRADWRDITGRQNTTDTEFSSGIEWRYRQLEMSLDGRYRIFEEEGTDGEVIGAMFKLKRHF